MIVVIQTKSIVLVWEKREEDWHSPKNTASRGKCRMRLSEKSRIEQRRKMHELSNLVIHIDSLSLTRSETRQGCPNLIKYSVSLCSFVN